MFKAAIAGLEWSDGKDLGSFYKVFTTKLLYFNLSVWSFVGLTVCNKCLINDVSNKDAGTARQILIRPISSASFHKILSLEVSNVFLENKI